MRLFIFGMGYSSHAIHERMKDECEWVCGTTRSVEKAEALTELGIDAFLFDGSTPNPEISDRLNEATHLVISAGPNEAGDPTINQHRQDILNSESLAWIGYLSTVGVYGNHDGAWVTEESECRPVSQRSVQRVAAEQAWRALAEEAGLPLAIFRLGGIYGPGRNAFVNFETGRAKRIIKKDQVFNRIHRTDIAEAVALAAGVKSGLTFNVIDNEPAPPQDVVTMAAELKGVTPPPEIPFEEAELRPMARSFYGENKRCSNARLKAELGMRFRYPTYREALTEMWETDSWRG
ncbi:SDR family oxidoreductase [Coralliovum pocilloporae]|uniref:SDR family oxidoreductase n=1 Tax=Coralliovum pocilloporae TaxID=3066369 RepID=UPI003307B140